MRHHSIALLAVLATACGGKVGVTLYGANSGGASVSAGGAPGSGSANGGVAGCASGPLTSCYQCATGLIRCGSVCIDPQTDPLNCGACNVACPSGTMCVSGLCEGGGGAAGASGSAGAGTGGASGFGGIGGSTCNTECLQASDCTLFPAVCCMCVVPSLSQFIAANKSSKACGSTGACCQCATSPNPNLAATCTAAGNCMGFDVRTVDAYSSCQSDADCRLRNGLACCESCQNEPFNLVAVSINQTALTTDMCGPDDASCPSCTVQYPAGKKAVCVEQHCQVQ